MSGINGYHKIVRDPIHNIIEVDSVALTLMDTYAFQRLRRIRQLGMAWMVYPGAEHSRLAHSVGVYGMSKRLIGALRANSRSFKLDAEEEHLVAIAGLLHDIGHGPFSHAFENAIKALGGSFSHEDMSARIILEHEEITTELEKVDKGFPEKVCQVINNTYSNPHVASIVSSQFDADRIDYLLRDSYMTGANYGKFDIDWLLKTIRIETATFPHVKGATVVSVDHKKGLNVLEQYLLGRHFMYTHVYYHKVIRGFELLVTNIIKRVLEKEHTELLGYDSIKILKSGEIPLDMYLRLDDFSVLSWFNDWYWCTNDPILKELLFHLFCRKPYYKVFYPPDHPLEYSKQRDQILNDLGDKGEGYFFQEDSPKNVTYKNLYVGDVLNEIYISKDDQVNPLSAVDESIINAGKAVLKKDEIRWYIHEGGDKDGTE